MKKQIAVIERDQSLEWTVLDEWGEVHTYETTHKHPGYYARLWDGPMGRYPQICVGGGRTGNTIEFASRAEAVGPCFARELGGRFYKTQRGYEAAVARMRRPEKKKPPQRSRDRDDGPSR